MCDLHFPCFHISSRLGDEAIRSLQSSSKQRRSSEGLTSWSGNPPQERTLSKITMDCRVEILAINYFSMLSRMRPLFRVESVTPNDQLEASADCERGAKVDFAGCVSGVKWNLSPNGRSLLLIIIRIRWIVLLVDSVAGHCLPASVWPFAGAHSKKPSGQTVWTSLVSISQ